MANGLITPRTFRFLRELANNNDRAWFTAHKQRYLEEVRDPLLLLVMQLAGPLAKISRHIVADPRPVGGSLFRIYRDTRFSADKRPYKTHAGLYFGPRTEGALGGGFYLHIEPRNVFMAAGVWRPDAAVLKKIRDAIVSRPNVWGKLVTAIPLSDHDEDRLKRAPQGYDPEHRFIEDLKRKSFTAGAQFTEAQACAEDFPERFLQACRDKAPLMSFLAKAVEMPW